METVVVSPKFQIVIPRAIRDAAGIQPGQKIQVMLYGDRIVLVPFRRMRQMRGFLKRIDTSVDREPDRV